MGKIGLMLPKNAVEVNTNINIMTSIEMNGSSKNKLGDRNHFDSKIRYICNDDLTEWLWP